MYDPVVIDVMDSLNQRWQCKPQGFISQNKSQFYSCVNRFGLWSHSHLCWPTRQYNNWI